MKKRSLLDFFGLLGGMKGEEFEKTLAKSRKKQRLLKKNSTNF